MDAIMGDDGSLIEKIKAALRDISVLRGIKVPCVSVVGSPVPMLIGFDFKGFASLLEHETGIPVFGFPADGFHHYDRGQRDAYMAIAERLLEKGVPKIKRAINILGASALDGFDGPSLDALEAALAEGGFTRLAVWGERSSWEELKTSPAAELNWLVSAAALPLARFFEERFGIPFVTGLPIGRGERERILSGMDACLAGEKSALQFSPNAPLEGEPETVIMGEPVFCRSLRAYLETSGASGQVIICSFFSQGRELPGKGDCFFTCEDDARERFSSPSLKRLIADPLVRALIPEGANVRFTPLPHRAVSGRLYNEGLAAFFTDSPSFCSETPWAR
jgi:hypothetical protein